MWVAKVRGKIRNITLNREVLRIITKLLTGTRGHILRAGRERADRMRQAFIRTHAMEWAPQAEEWLADSKYVWYLGILSVNH
jgi:hypothetical protein